MALTFAPACSTFAAQIIVAAAPGLKARTQMAVWLQSQSIDAANECTRVGSTTSPGLLGGRPTNVPILQSGLAVIWKLHMNAPSGMHSLPAPNTIHLGPLHRTKTSKRHETTMYQRARAGKRNWECGTEVPLRKKFQLHRPTCTCFQTMP